LTQTAVPEEQALNQYLRRAGVPAAGNKSPRPDSTTLLPHKVPVMVRIIQFGPVPAALRVSEGESSDEESKKAVIFVKPLHGRGVKIMMWTVIWTQRKVK